MVNLMENFKEFSDVLIDYLKNYDKEYDEFINNAPALYLLLIDILNEKKIDPVIRLKISAALAYFVAPYDIIPEKIYGPMGFVDDIYITVLVLKNIKNELGMGYLESLWKGNGDLTEVIEECYENSIDILGEEVNKIIKYVGLDYLKIDSNII